MLKKEEFKVSGLSTKEVKVVANLEFNQQSYFKREDILNLFKNNKEMTNILYSLTKKKRVIRLNKNKYFLIPIKARSGKWTDEPFIIIDETLNGKNYFIGNWAAANYWRLTDQIPFRYDVYTTRRQGLYKLLGVSIFFHRTTVKKIKKAIIKKINNHTFLIMNKKEMEKWMKLRE